MIKLKDILNEQDAGTSGAVGGFVGRRGQDIDDLFAGAFYPSKKDLMDLLEKQVDNSKKKTKYSKDNTPPSDIDWESIAPPINYDEYSKYSNNVKLKDFIDLNIIVYSSKIKPEHQKKIDMKTDIIQDTMIPEKPYPENSSRETRKEFRDLILIMVVIAIYY